MRFSLERGIKLGYRKGIETGNVRRLGLWQPGGVFYPA